MDQRRFDRLARSIGNPASRRGVVKLFAGGSLGALLSRLGAGEVGAGRSPGQLCERNRECVKGAYCHQKRCRCRNKLERCEGFCVPKGTCPDQQCLPARTVCSPTEPDNCCGPSTCTGLFEGQQVCCGVANVHRCTPGVDDALCCSGKCGTDGNCD